MRKRFGGSKLENTQQTLGDLTVDKIGAAMTLPRGQAGDGCQPIPLGRNTTDVLDP
ncbi:MAG: hypothetical protein HOK97_14605 [Deltaproteobacteria bacterium]|nr:hypothetical protein [Deltaproteobacteria bacterium]